MAMQSFVIVCVCVGMCVCRVAQLVAAKVLSGARQLLPSTIRVRGNVFYM